MQEDEASERWLSHEGCTIMSEVSAIWKGNSSPTLCPCFSGTHYVVLYHERPASDAYGSKSLELWELIYFMFVCYLVIGVLL